jgi:hypothetical protein
VSNWCLGEGKERPAMHTLNSDVLQARQESNPQRRRQKFQEEKSKWWVLRTHSMRKKQQGGFWCRQGLSFGVF